MSPLLPLTGKKNKYNVLPILYMAFFHSISRSEIILNQYIHIISSLPNGYMYYTIIQICHKEESQLCMFRLFQVSRYSNNSCIFYQQHKPWYRCASFSKINSHKWELGAERYVYFHFLCKLADCPSKISKQNIYFH